MKNTHWEFDSECPKCGKTNHVKTSVGNLVVRVHCEHCTHGYEYTHIVNEHEEVKDDQENSQNLSQVNTPAAKKS